VVYGVSVVLLVWTDGHIRIPLGYRVWKKGGPSKVELALEVLSYARNRLKCKPQFVRFDSWYPSKALLTRMRDYGWYFVCQLKKNRCFEGVALHKYLHQPYWQAVGFLTGRIKVRVVKYRRQYYATNRLSLTAPEVRQLYRLRQGVEIYQPYNLRKSLIVFKEQIMAAAECGAQIAMTAAEQFQLHRLESPKWDATHWCPAVR
jgi:hypothetical protein